MDRLIKLLAAIWDWFAWLARTLVDGAISFAQTLWAKWLIAAGWILAMVTLGKEMLNKLTHIIGSWIFDQFHLAIPDIVVQSLAVANYCFPIVECIVLTIAYLQVLIIMVAYRHYKSLVPGAVSGGT